MISLEFYRNCFRSDEDFDEMVELLTVTEGTKTIYAKGKCIAVLMPPRAEAQISDNPEMIE